MTEVQVDKLGQFLQLFINLCDLVSAQVQSFERRQGALPSVEAVDLILCEIKLLEPGAIFESRQALKLIVGSRENAKGLVSSPAFVDFLELVTRNVEVVKLGALEGGPFVELVVGDVEPL